jgi:hypothetical protein
MTDTNRRTVGLSIVDGSGQIESNPRREFSVTIREIRRLTTFGQRIVLGSAVALACPGCASKEKVATFPDGMGASMTPPPTTASYDPARQIASGASGSPFGPMPSAIAPEFNR